ncbi:MAG: DNA polymerase [Planctomycetaceae bacterium]|nr:DNA polymerase [Planctomycetaceae bacterium]
MINVCEPFFENYQIFDSYASRKGKGQFTALERAKRFSRKNIWFLKLDIRKYFDSISRDVLKRLLFRRFKDVCVLQNFEQIIDSYESESGRGVPIGNLTSQYFANHYLAVLDHFVKEQLRVGCYVRYMDDFVLWHDDVNFLKQAARTLENFLAEELRLTVKPPFLNRCDHGMTFLGFRVFPDKIVLSHRSRYRFRRKLRAMTEHFASGAWDESTYARHTVQTYRSSSGNPNFQNLPARDKRMSEIVRRCFIARGPDRHFVEIDFASSEVKCLAADTIIATPDGNQSIEAIVHRLQNGEHVRVYSWDHIQNRIAVHQAVGGWKTEDQADVWEIVLNNGKSVKATANHLFMLPDGTYRRLDELRVEDHLMSTCLETQNSMITDIHYAGKADVYDIEVETVHNFALAAGVIVHNCSAAYHNDPAMLHYLSDKATDMHRDMAAQCYQLPLKSVNKTIRNLAKGNFVFAAFYGASWKSMADALWNLPRIQQVKLDDGTLLTDHLKSVGFKRLGVVGVNNVPEPGSYYEYIKEVEFDFWNHRFATYGKWKRDTWFQYLRDGYVDYLSGFRCAGVFPKNEVLNMPIQGLSCHCLLWSMNQINNAIKKYGWKTVLIGQIHDSIEADVPADELDMFLELAHQVMTVKLHKHWKFLTAKMEIEAEVAGLGETWFDKKPYTIKNL